MTIKLEIDKYPFGSEELRAHYRDFHRATYEHGTKYMIKNFCLLSSIVIGIALLIPTYHLYFIPLFFIYFIFANGLEYLLHKYPMHHKTNGLEVIYEHVTDHHNFYANEKYYYEEPTDYYAVMLPKIILGMTTGVIVIISAIIWLISDIDNAMFFALVCYGYYLMYEVLHFTYHCQEGHLFKKIPFIRTLSQHHLTHHQTHLMTDYNFNITFPIFDLLLGTMYTKDSAHKKSASI